MTSLLNIPSHLKRVATLYTVKYINVFKKLKNHGKPANSCSHGKLPLKQR